MSEVKWNKQQQEAINARDTSIIVSAAAGSGKTAVLVRRLLEILSDEALGVRADRIAVVTFTNDAAAQMKQRLTDALDAALDAEPHNHWLRSQQNLISSAKISTIHTFCFDMIKDNTKDLDVSSGFRILDESDEKILLSKALDNVFERLYSDPATASVMDRLVEFFSTGERKDANLENAVLKIYDFLMSIPFPMDWLEKAKGNYTETDPLKNIYAVRFYEHTVSQLEFCLRQQKQALYTICKLMEDNAKLASLASVSGAAEDITATIAQIEETLYSLKNTDIPWDERIQVSICSPGKKRSYAKSAEFTSANDLHRRYMEKAVSLAEDIRRFTSENIKCDLEISHEILTHLTMLLDMLIKEMAALKSEKNALGFSDAEQLAIRLLCRKDESGKTVRTELAQGLSEYYKLIMIDEFQDANENQNLIFRLLSHNGTPEKNGDNLFVVGDVKQSIYGFRLANPAIFREAFRNADDYSQEYSGSNSRIVFNRNYRSSNDVIDFTNFVFEHLMTEDVGGVDYNDNEKLVMGASYPEKDRSTTLLMRDYSKATEQMNIKEAEADAVAAEIASMIGKVDISDGDTVRKCKASDFCILLRDNKRGQLYTDALMRYGIDGVCEETEGYLESREIAVLINFLRIIDNPLCNIPMVSVLMSAIFMLTADDIAQIRLTGENSIYNCVKEYMKTPVTAENSALHERLAYFTAVLNKLRRDASSMNLEKLIRTIYDSTDFLSSVQAFDDGIQKRANLRQLLVYAESYEQNYDGGLSGFIRYLDDICRSSDLKRASVVSNSDAVSIKTIHKSKGLEYPFVFLCGTSKKFCLYDEKDICLLNNDLGIAFTIQDHNRLYKYEPVSYKYLKAVTHRSTLSEELRLLYVAMTRAKEQLFISMVNELGSKGTTTFASRAKLFCGMITAADGITPDIAAEAASMRDWLIMAYAVHPAFDEYANNSSIKEYLTIFTDSRLRVITSDPEKKHEDLSENYDDTFISEETVQLLTDRFTKAEQENYISTAAKFTITEIAKNNEELTLELPEFSQKYAGLTAAQAGTAMHTFMQYADFNAAEKSTDSVAEEADRLEEMGILSAPERQSLDIGRLFGFFDSDLYRRMKKSDEICREKKFLIKISELSLDDNQAEEYNNNSMLQGIADCFFVEDGGIVLIDYKTDRVRSEDVLIGRYALQLRLYSAAFEKIRGLKVKEAYLYSFSLGRKVRIPID